jgi:hypothetical protein
MRRRSAISCRISADEKPPKVRQVRSDTLGSSARTSASPRRVMCSITQRRSSALGSRVISPRSTRPSAMRVMFAGLWAVWATRLPGFALPSAEPYSTSARTARLR